MALRKSQLFWMVALCIVLIPTAGCENDRDQMVPVSPGITSPTQIADWLEQLRAIIRATNTTGAEASRILAYSSIAYYEGYSLAFDDMRSLVGQLKGLDHLPAPNPNQTYNYGIIAESAMTTCLLRLFEDAPQNIQLIISSTYSGHEREYIKLGVAQSVVNRSRALGEVIGEAIKVWMDGDGYAELANCNITAPTDANSWQPTPPSYSTMEFACWGNLRAFTFTDDQLVALCHPGFPSQVSTNPGSAYYSQLNEVVSLSENLTADQEATALFWNDMDGKHTVPGHYISILKQLIDQNLLDGKQTVTAWTQLCIAMADAYISSYKLKYTYFRPRPISIIQNEIDQNWESFSVNPATPEYPSLRTTISYASTQVFVNLYGDIPFTDASFSQEGVAERSYESFLQMANEVAESRLYAGTNLRATVENSEYHGRCIAQRANELFLNQ